MGVKVLNNNINILKLHCMSPDSPNYVIWDAPCSGDLTARRPCHAQPLLDMAPIYPLP